MHSSLIIASYFMSHCEFEPKIQIECVLELVGLVRNQQLIEKRGEALQHLGCVLGSLGAKIDESGPIFAETATCEASLDVCCNELEAQLTGEGAQINPAVLAVIMQFISLLLKQLL